MQKDELDLRDQTKAFALRIVKMFSALPKTTVAQGLGKQLLRSGTSIGANTERRFAPGAALGVSAFVLAAIVGGVPPGPVVDDRGERRNIRERAGPATAQSSCRG